MEFPHELNLAICIYSQNLSIYNQALDKIPGEDSEVEAELFKNLWIEAEASLCTMKYELQLARTKLKMKSQKHAQEGFSHSFCNFSFTSFVTY